MSAKKSNMIGAISGVLIATITVLCAMLNADWENEILRGTTNFIASVPTLLLSRWLDLPQILQNILFFVYWAIIGGLLGLLLSCKDSFIKTVSVILAVVSLVIAHRVVQVTLETELSDALRGLEALFTGKAHLGAPER